MTGDELRREPLPADLDRLLHDLRGPLNAATMHLEVLKRLLGDDSTGRESLLAIQRELERLATMLPVAMSICALERDPQQRLSLRDVVESAVEESARKQVAIAPDPWPDVQGDERLLGLAVRHLVLNALDAAGPDGEVHAGVELGPGETVTLVVHDTGAGFGVKNPSARVRLMGGGKPGHLGIGLLVAQRIARLHGGTLTFATHPDGGGVVRLSVSSRVAR